MVPVQYSLFLITVRVECNVNDLVQLVDTDLTVQVAAVAE